MSRFLPRGGLGGGGAGTAGNDEPDWTLLASTTQAGNAPTDTGGIHSSSAFDGDTFSVICAAHAAQVDGYREAISHWDLPLLTLYPDFDPAQDRIEVLLDARHVPRGTVEAGVHVGIVDSATWDSNLLAGMACWRMSTTATDQIQSVAATGPNATDNIGLIDFMAVTFEWSRSPTVWECLVTVRAFVEGSQVWELGFSQKSGLMRDQIAQWQLVTGLLHGSIDSLAGTCYRWRVWHKRTRRPNTPPAVAPAAKPTGGRLDAVVLGDSTGLGTGNPYAAGALPAGVRLWENGVEISPNWPDNGGTGPDVGFLEAFALAALADGITDLRIYRWASNGASTNTVRTTNAYDAHKFFVEQGIEPRLWIMSAGTNDMQAGEAAGLLASGTVTWAEGRRGYPDARTIWVKPAVLDQAGWEDADEGRAHIDTIATYDGGLYRAVVENAGVEMGGGGTGNHPTPTGYATQGARIWTVYSGMV